MDTSHLKKSLSEQSAGKIIQIIKENNLQEGDKLPNENELAQKLNVSRGTVREAISTLISRKIVVSQRGSGTFISSKCSIPDDPLGLTFIKDHYKLMPLDITEIRLYLEPKMAALATARATTEEKQSILKQCDIVEDLIKQHQNYNEADAAFHSLIAKASGNQIMERLIPILTYGVDTAIDETKNALTAETVYWHRQVALCINNGDMDGAQNSMLCHLEINRKAIYDKLISNIN